MYPMCAFRFKDHRTKIKYPVYIQPKLDGVRALYCNGRMQSRDELIWNPKVVEHITQHIPSVFDGWVLDGEFYHHGWPLGKINGAIAIKRTEPTKLTNEIEYHVFDYANPWDPNIDFAFRRQGLQDMFNDWIDPSSPIKLVSTEIADSARAEQLYTHFTQLGYEGTMYRDGSAPYGFTQNCTNKENRWTCLLKRKGWMDDWFPILDWEPGEGKYKTMVGSLKLQMPTGEVFFAGSGLSDFERKDLLNQDLSLLRAHVRYERLSADGIPLKPTILELDEIKNIMRGKRLH